MCGRTSLGEGGCVYMCVCVRMSVTVKSICETNRGILGTNCLEEQVSVIRSTCIGEFCSQESGQIHRQVLRLAVVNSIIFGSEYRITGAECCYKEIGECCIPHMRLYIYTICLYLYLYYAE